MKNILVIFIFIFCFFLFKVDVKAETINYDYLYYSVPVDGSGFYVYEVYADFKSYLDSNSYYSWQDVEDAIQELKSEYEKKYKKDYSYYFISLCLFDSLGHNYSLVVDLKALDAIPLGFSNFESYLNSGIDYCKQISLKYENGVKQSILNSVCSSDFNIFNNFSDGSFYTPFFYYESNFDLKFDLEDTYVVNKNNKEYFTLSKGDFVPSYKNIYQNDDKYEEINLNDYAYVALALKNYNQDAFNSVVSVKGSFCATPVYKYGMTPKDDIVHSRVTDRCSLYYDNFTNQRFYILDNDLKNHAIYYLKAYDKTKENIVKVDTSIFDVTTISEEDANNPSVYINGRYYPTIPYDDLPSTATKNEEENFAPGASEEFNFSLSFADIFKSPLEFIKNIWSSITNVFTLIGYFISILPETFQYFLYASFMLAIVLGLIKIIL